MNTFNYFSKVVILIILFVLAPFTANTQTETKLIASDGKPGDLFGQRVAIDEEYIIVGASMDDNIKGTDAGAAYVFRLIGEEWMETQKIIASDIADSSLFGYAVDLDGDYAVISACWSDELGEKAGAAYIYKLEGTNWIEQAKLTAHDAEEDDRFGISAAISGDYAVVGSFFDDDFGSRSGSAYIFARNGTNWTQEAKLVPSDGAANDWFGVNLSIDGAYAVIGSRYNDNPKGIDAGAVYIFKREQSGWVEQEKLLPTDSVDKVLFEVSAIEGDNLIVGARMDDEKITNGGAFYFFERSGNNWLKSNKLFASDAEAQDQFGSSVAIFEDRIVIGAYLDDDLGRNSGSCYVFKWNGDDWVEETKLTASDGDSLDYFGLPVDIDNEYVVVSARQDDDNGENAGAVYVYKFETTPVQEYKISTPSKFELYQNIPNPLIHESMIRYQIPSSAQVTLQITDIHGQAVKTLLNESKDSGIYQVWWNGNNDEGISLPGGIYFCTLKTGSNISSIKMILLR